jgi:hypothetical protein
LSYLVKTEEVIEGLSGFSLVILKINLKKQNGGKWG